MGIESGKVGFLDKMRLTDTLKVLHLVGDREDAGGVLSVLRNLQSVTQANEVQHCVWVKDGYRETRSPSLDYRYSKSVVAESTNHLKLFAQAIPAYRELRSLIQKEPFDILHAHSRGTLLVAILAARRMHRPVVFTNHNYARRCGLYRWAAKQPHMHTVVLTPNMATHYGLDEAMPRLKIISACFSQSLLETPLMESTRRRKHDPLRLIGVGNVIGWKKWDLLAKALNLMTPEERARIQCDIWGPTPDLPEAHRFDKSLRELIQVSGLTQQIQLKGPTQDVQSKLRQADWFVIPSTNEPCSVALMEALAVGMPALVSRSGGNVDLVQEGCGLHFKPDDAASLAEQLKAILGGTFVPKNPSDIRNSVDSRSASLVFRQYRSLYQNLNRDLT
jgi:glycosyltransferase involved in cell wall biosynthesis